MISSNNTHNTRSLIALGKKEFLVPFFSMTLQVKIIFVLLFLLLGGTSFGFSTACAFVLVTSSISLDEKHKIDPFLCSLPVKRRDIVFAKYLNSWLTGFGFIGFTVVLIMLLSLLGVPGIDTTGIFAPVYYSFLFMFNAWAIFFPAHFKFIGTFNKSIFSFAFVFILIVLFSGLFTIIVVLNLDFLDTPLLPLWCFIGTIILNALSLFLSNYFYKKNELTI